MSDNDGILLQEYIALSNLINNAWTIMYTLLAAWIPIFGIILRYTYELNGDHASFYAQLLATGCLYVFPLTLVLILGQITRSIWLFSLRLSHIAGIFKEYDIIQGEIDNFWHRWHKFSESIAKCNVNSSCDSNQIPYYVLDDKRSLLNVFRTLPRQYMDIYKDYKSVIAGFLTGQFPKGCAGSLPFFTITEILYLIASIFIISIYVPIIIHDNPLWEKVWSSVLLIGVAITWPSIRMRIHQELNPLFFYGPLKEIWRVIYPEASPSTPSRTG